MDFEKHFDFIDSLTEKPNEKNVNCCSLQENIEIEQGMTKCKVCSNIISNIVDNPEWRYYGNVDTKSSDQQDVVCLLIHYFQNRLWDKNPVRVQTQKQ